MLLVQTFVSCTILCVTYDNIFGGCLKFVMPWILWCSAFYTEVYCACMHMEKSRLTTLAVPWSITWCSAITWSVRQPQFVEYGNWNLYTLVKCYGTLFKSLYVHLNGGWRVSLFNICTMCYNSCILIALRTHVSSLRSSRSTWLIFGEIFYHAQMLEHEGREQIKSHL